MRTEDKWATQAQYDLETADAMFASGRHLYVLFCCQQAVEKALKALIVKRTGEFPPRVHNLLRLAETAKISLEPDHRQFLGDLSGYYIQTRYPEEIEYCGTDVTPEISEEALRKTREAIEWLFSMLK